MAKPLIVTPEELAIVQRVRNLTARTREEGLADYLLDEAGRERAMRLCRRSVLKSHRWRGTLYFRCGRLASHAVLDPGPPPYKTADDVPSGVTLVVVGGTYTGRTFRVLSRYGDKSVIGHTGTNEEIVVLARLLRPQGEGRV